MVLKAASNGAVKDGPKTRRGRKAQVASPDSAGGGSWASREVPQEELSEKGAETRQRLKLKCMTVNVPESVMDMLQLHADRRLDTLTTVVREALVKYLRETTLPDPIDFSATE